MRGDDGGVCIIPNKIEHVNVQDYKMNDLLFSFCVA